MRKVTQGIPASVVMSINYFRYREAFKMSAQEFANEPSESIKEAFLIWSLDDKLKSMKGSTN